MDLEQFFESERLRVANNFNRSKHKGFKDKNDMANWFVDELKKNDCQCYYCETSIHDIIKLINSGFLKERKTGHGFRGKVLEIDKNDDFYTKKDCVVSCYYCNNDKSYTLGMADYKEHFGLNRKLYFQKLTLKLNRI